MDVKDRLQKAPKRIQLLYQKYPIVGVVLVLGGIALGFFLGRLF